MTVCGVSQSAGVKTTELVESDTSEVTSTDKSMVTFPVGCFFRTTVKESVPPDSDVTSPETGLIMTPGMGSTATSCPQMSWNNKL